MSRVPLLLHPFLSAGSPQAWAAAAAALPLTPASPGTPPLPPWIQLLGWAASQDSACGQHDQGRKEGPPHPALPARFFQTPVTSRRRPATPQGPGSVPFTCTTTRDGAAAGRGSPPARRGRSRRQPARLHSLEGGRAGVRGQDRGSGEGVMGRRGTHREHEDREKWGPPTAGYTLRRGAGMGGSAGYGGGAGRREGRRGRARRGPRAGRGRGPRRFRKARDGVAERRKLPPGRFRAPARGAPALSGLSRRGPPGLPLSTRTLSRPGVHDPELHLGAAQGSRPRVARRARLGDAPGVRAPTPGPLGPATCGGLGRSARGAWTPGGARAWTDGGPRLLERNHTAGEGGPGSAPRVLLVSHQHLKIVHVVTYVTD